LEAFQGGFSPAIVKFVGTLRQSGARSSDRETRNQKAHGDVILAFSRLPSNPTEAVSEPHQTPRDSFGEVFICTEPTVSAR
jgi:hypothetical protein